MTAKLRHLLTVAALMSAAPLHAASLLDVLVVDATQGTPVANSAVCIGTAANTVQFGAARTDTLGRARFRDLPAFGVAATVSADGYRGRQMPLDTRGGHRTVKIVIARGGLGPQCQAPSTARVSGARAETVRIQRASVRSVGNALRIEIKASGAPNQIRVAPPGALDSTAWRPYAGALEIPAPPGARSVLVQVRQAVEKDGMTLARESAPVERAIR